MELKLSASDFVFERKSKLRDIYRIGQKVGEGAFSSVRMIRHRPVSYTHLTLPTNREV